VISLLRVLFEKVVLSHDLADFLVVFWRVDRVCVVVSRNYQDVITVLDQAKHIDRFDLLEGCFRHLGELE
jgi:hypothetical protein